MMLTPRSRGMFTPVELGSLQPSQVFLSEGVADGTTGALAATQAPAVMVANPIFARRASVRMAPQVCV
jgi:hypothetical protein